MIKSLFTSLTAAALLAAALPAFATTVVDTGTPDGSAVGALAFDTQDWAAAQVTFTQASQIDAIQAHVLGGSAGDTFDITLFSDNGDLPGDVLYNATATFDADGWNGLSSLSGWTVAAGTYWVGFEIQGDDSLGSSSVTGALLDLGAPDPLAVTATTNDGWHYQDSGALSFGLQVNASTVPWPSSASLMLAALGLLSALRFGRRAR
jgi:hypothetical protein